MQNVNITNFRKNIYKMMESAIKYNEPINICTKNGNAVLISEEDYNGLMETLYIESIPGLKEEILERGSAPAEDFISEEEVEW
ncbi:MAG: type II toxin-antitoxin system Phd/YefM family antitoxin [Clostridiales bacterium]|nr:type II toxin-antitoxin system Phd/YefM family antitoxin [Clostridiales bacterium]